MLKTLLFFVAISSTCFPQQKENESLDYVPPTPTIGWDSIRSLIRYPEILRRAAFEGAAEIYVEVDSTGRADTIAVRANSPLFAKSVRDALSRTTWIPARLGQRTVNALTTRSVHFYVKEHEASRISVEVDPATIKPDH